MWEISPAWSDKTTPAHPVAPPAQMAADSWAMEAGLKKRIGAHARCSLYYSVCIYIYILKEKNILR